MNARERTVRSILDSPHARQLELRLDDLRPDRVRVAMPFGAGRTTARDVVHGGAIAALLDTAATAAAWSGVAEPTGHRGTTVGFTIQFLDAALGEDLVADARVVRRGGSLCVLAVTVRGDGGKHVAEGLVTYKLSRLGAVGESGA